MEKKEEKFFYSPNPGIKAIYNKISYGRGHRVDFEEISKNFVLEGTPILQSENTYSTDKTVAYLSKKKCYVARNTGFVYFNDKEINVLPFISTNDQNLTSFIIIPNRDFTKLPLTKEYINQSISSFGFKSAVSGEVAGECIALHKKSGGYKILYQGTKMIPDRENDVFLDEVYHVNEDSFFLLEGRRVISPKEIEFYTPVNEGDKIGDFKEFIAGKEGEDIFGNPIPKRQIQSFYKIGEGLKQNSDKEIIALKNGVLRINIDGRLTVKETQIINRDIKVDLHVEGSEDVIITGRIYTNVNIKVKGDLVILGSVEKIRIDCGGNLFLTNGINNQSVINVDGDCYFQFIANSTLKVGGQLWVGQYIGNSEITAQKNVVVRTNQFGEIIGGKVESEKGYIETNSVGSVAGNNTFLRVGRHQSKKEFVRSNKLILKGYTDEKFVVEQKIHKMKPIIETIYKRWKTNPERFSSSEVDQFKANVFIFKELKEKNSELEKKISELESEKLQKFTEKGSSEIKIFGGIFGGVTVQIKNVKHFYKYNIYKGVILRKDAGLPRIKTVFMEEAFK